MEDQQTSTGITHNRFKGKTVKEILELQHKMGTKKFSRLIKQGNKDENNEKKSNINPIFFAQNSQPVATEDNNKDKFKPTERRMIKNALPLEGKKKKFPKNANNTPSFRDPRFDDLSGKLNMDQWRKNYTFISKKRTKEKTILINTHKRCMDDEEKARLQKSIHRMQNQEREHGKQEKLRIMKRGEKDKAIEALKEGKKPYFISDVKKMKQINKEYVEGLKNKDKYFVRKEKKLISKERKKSLIPHT